MNFDRSQFLGKFAQEATDLVQKLNEGLLQLEKDPRASELLKDLLRAAHTLKGSSKIMRFQKISQLAHKMEDLLISIQDGQVKFQDEIFELLFKNVDLISSGIDEICRHAEDSIDIENICAIFDAAVQGEDIRSRIEQLNPSLSQALVQETASSEGVTQEDADQVVAGTGEEPVPSPAMSITTRGDTLSGASVEKSDLQPPIQETIRVDIGRLDDAIRLVGEITVSHKRAERTLGDLKELQRLARTHLKEMQRWHQRTSDAGGSGSLEDELVQQSFLLLKGLERVFKGNHDEIAMMDLLLSELYENVLNMRMLPLSILFDTFPRAVRDLTKYFHKNIELQMSGEDSLLDKKIIERLNAPLIHILRNCIDHGIETPEERLTRGKSRTGLIMIRAYHQNGYIKIEIRDDGQGIPVEKLKQRAIQRGILSEEQAAGLSREELIELVFWPRLSTSDLITDISGRGMGMDIVKTCLEQLKGQVTLCSRPNEGTTYLLTLPTTLTTIRCLIIACQRKLFAVPINAIEETLQLASHEFIEVLGHAAIRLRNQIIYVMSLADLFGLPQTSPLEQEKAFVLITSSNGKRVGLIVDAILDEQDIVVKPLPPHIQKVKTIAGATISSENTIILILHIPEIVEQIKHITVAAPDARNADYSSHPPRILVVDDSVNTGEIEKRILEAYGYEVDVVYDGVEALEQITRAVYDLVITDIEMPKMDGFTLTEHVRALPKYAEVPIIIVSSLERESDKKRGLQVGANAYITKGNFEQRSLIETVKSLV